jgi:hypothetical protein
MMIYLDYKKDCIVFLEHWIVNLFCGLSRSRIVQEMVLPWSGQSIFSSITNTAAFFSNSTCSFSN